MKVSFIGYRILAYRSFLCIIHAFDRRTYISLMDKTTLHRCSAVKKSEFLWRSQYLCKMYELL